MKLLISGLVAVAVFLAAFVLIQHREIQALRAVNASFFAETEQIVSLSGDRPLPTTTDTRLDGTGGISEAPSSELLRLRGEVALLRRELRDLGTKQNSPEVREEDKRHQGFQFAIDVLSSRFKEEEPRKEASRQKLAQLESTLQLPEQIIIMDPLVGMKDPSATRFRDYFIAKEEFLINQQICQRLLFALGQMSVDDELPKTGTLAQ